MPPAFNLSQDQTLRFNPSTASNRPPQQPITHYQAPTPMRCLPQLSKILKPPPPPQPQQQQRTRIVPNLKSMSTPHTHPALMALGVVVVLLWDSRRFSRRTLAPTTAVGLRRTRQHSMKVNAAGILTSTTRAFLSPRFCLPPRSASEYAAALRDDRRGAAGRFCLRPLQPT